MMPNEQMNLPMINPWWIQDKSTYLTTDEYTIIDWEVSDWKSINVLMATQKHGKMDDAKKEKAKAKLEDLKIILMDPNFINFYYVIKNQDINENITFTQTEVQDTIPMEINSTDSKNGLIKHTTSKLTNVIIDNLKTRIQDEGQVKMIMVTCSTMELEGSKQSYPRRDCK